MLLIDVGVAKVPKYAVRESGDSVEIIERPRGGISMVMADGQSSGKGAKAISNIAVRKVISLLAEGIRDGAAARAAHDYLRNERGGKVSAELVIVSADLESRSLLVSRNSRCPVIVGEAGGWRLLDEPADVVGIYARTRPVITEISLQAEQTIVAFTDGFLHAGSRRGRGLDPLRAVQDLACWPVCTAQAVADSLLDAALTLDERRPVDDTSVLVVRVTEGPADGDVEIRRMCVTFPVPPV